MKYNLIYFRNMSTIANLVLHVQTALNIESYDESISKEIASIKDLSKKARVIQAIQERSKEVTIEDLPRIEEELSHYFEEFKNSDYFEDINSNDYYRFLDLRKEDGARVVVIGDIHCDYKALVALLLKLSVAEYDFYEKAYFVFLGDYLDRGGALFEPLLLLMDIQRILGKRMIMLRGNHELINYNEETQELEGSVIPQDSVPVLNEYCGKNKDFLCKFGFFYKTLPTYVYLKAGNQNVLLTHGSIPRQKFLDTFYFDHNTGAIQFESEFLYNENIKIEKSIFDDSLKSKTLKFNIDLLNYRNQILYDMIWGDPSPDREKYQVRGRFQFGSAQYEEYAKKNNISRLFRSHEPVELGFVSFFDDRLFTIFSTGGCNNEQSGYLDVNPAFAVINEDGSYIIENSYIYRFDICGVVNVYCDLNTGDCIKLKAAKQYALNDEFFCSTEKALKINALFAEMNAGFPLPETETEIVETIEENPKEVISDNEPTESNDSFKDHLKKEEESESSELDEETEDMFPLE